MGRPVQGETGRIEKPRSDTGAANARRPRGVGRAEVEATVVWSSKFQIFQGKRKEGRTQSKRPKLALNQFSDDQQLAAVALEAGN